MARKKKPESVLSDQVSNLLRTKYDVPFRFDIGADVPLPPVHAMRGKSLHGKWSTGFPDLVVYGKGSPLFLELKATDTVPNTAHTRRQAVYHQILRNNGYEVHFACGFKEAKKIIKEYMKAKV